MICYNIYMKTNKENVYFINIFEYIALDCFRLLVFGFIIREDGICSFPRNVYSIGY